MESKLFDEEDIKQEAKKHNDFLNTGVGLISFTLALTCLSFNDPQKAALLCFPIVLGILLQARNHFPPTLREIKILEKETKDEHVIEVRKYLDKKYLGVKSLLTKNLLYWYGCSFYLVVLVIHEYIDVVIELIFKYL
ncbi:hypothetical protein [Parendozoicomonas haliclonae]|uniref:Uncharacterized protein n=1 Tax=Parendozoicomonas haliclonae TaxID=1960125 RepID=A0A1X7AMV6_9GAMM|nr:hypothetical protein [Parendozoicomonas haliclonae]SMA49404.1 hypothetical protein EHSB41UT_03241 [Parendozoicomonas haliclonae]